MDASHIRRCSHTDTRHDEIFDYLENQARAADGVKPTRGAPFRLAACLVCDGRIVSVGLNSTKTHPLQKRFSKNSESIMLHAEIDALVKGMRYVAEGRCSLYILRLKNEGNKLVRAMAMPCSGCMRAIRHFNIRKIYYTNDQDTYTIID